MRFTYHVDQVQFTSFPFKIPTISISSFITLYSIYIEGCQSYLLDKNVSDQPVKIYKNENWYYLCFNSLSINEADVICHENGFFNGAESVSSTSRSHLRISHEIYPYNISCQGNESSLCDCSMMQSQCTEDKIATIKCVQPGINHKSLNQEFSTFYEMHTPCDKEKSISTSIQI